jgi:hypothetical protein
MRSDIVPFFDAARHNFWLLFACRAHGIESELHLVVVEELEDAPVAATGAVLEF